MFKFEKQDSPKEKIVKIILHEYEKNERSLESILHEALSEFEDFTISAVKDAINEEQN